MEEIKKGNWILIDKNLNSVCVNDKHIDNSELGNGSEVIVLGGTPPKSEGMTGDVIVTPGGIRRPSDLGLEWYLISG